MGVVYEGTRSSDSKRVAIKVLTGELAARPVARARFLREARLTARVRHPHIVEIIDAGEELGRIYLVMELLDGEDLARRLQRSGAIPIVEAADILVTVCDAVATGHRCGVTHRDLKPSNIFLSVKDGRTHPIVLDFGIAKAEDEAEVADTAGEGAPVVLGTPMYLAPELIEDHLTASPSSDQYALGVILYESLTGEQPYAADDLERLFHAITAGNPPWPRARRSDIPLELDRIVQRAMSRDPRARFSSVAALGLALLPFVSTPAERARLGRRRPPSSPAIEIEAATPSPFVRTLIPEVQAESGPSFFAPALSDQTSGKQTIQSSAPADFDDARGEIFPALQVVPDLEDASDAGRKLERRRWRIAIVSAVALGGVALVLLVRSGRSAPERTSPTEVDRAPPTPAGPPAPAVNRETAPVQAVAAEPALSVPLVPPPVPPVLSSAPPRRERPASAPAAPMTNGVSREHISTPRFRGRESTEVQMHNGVPLLD